MNYFDASTWVGRWPFSFCDEHSPRSLVEGLRKHGIGRALVSPLDAVFAPEPGPANQALLKATRREPEIVSAPVINPALANWREQFSAAVADPRVRAVRLLPNYHNYRLNSADVDGLAEASAAQAIRLIVQVRLIDERHEYHAMKLKAVPIAELDGFLKRHRPLAVMASGLLRSELLSLVPKHPQLLADLSFAEWHDTIPHLLAKVPARQLAFASHTPLLITAAARAKLDTAEITEARRRAIAAENLERFLR